MGRALLRGHLTPSKYACKDDFAAFEMTDTTATCTGMFPAPPSSAWRGAAVNVDGRIVIGIVGDIGSHSDGGGSDVYADAQGRMSVRL